MTKARKNGTIARRSSPDVRSTPIPDSIGTMPAPEPAETEHDDLTDAEFDARFFAAAVTPASPSSTPCGGLAGPVSNRRRSRAWTSRHH
jgi:hypothetical protein